VALWTFAYVEGEFSLAGQALAILPTRLFKIDRDGAALHDPAGNHHVGDGCHYLRLYQTLQRPRTILRVVALFGQMFERRLRKGKRNVFVCKTLRDDLYLHAHYLHDGVLRKDVEQNYLVEAIEEFRAEELLERIHNLRLRMLVAFVLGRALAAPES